MFLMEEFGHLKIQLQDIISATDNFSPNKLIGHGGFGKVYKGELSLSKGRSIVALKRLDRIFGQGNTEFWKEIMMLSKCKHENLVSLLHFCVEGDEMILVYEYASRGSLDRHLSNPSLTWIQRLKICVGVAHGLSYLHDPIGMTFSTIANQCIQRDHKKRPTMVEIVQKLVVAIEEQLEISTIDESDEINHIGVQLQPTIPETTATRGIEESSSGPGEGSDGGQNRKLWVKDRSKGWWEYYKSDECSDEDFKKVFRMTKSTFHIICDELSPRVTKKDTMLRMAIPVTQRVAVCLYRLATGDPLRTVSTRFGLGISTCHKLVLEVCAAIKNVLMPKFLHWPDDERLEEIKTEFRSIFGIPNVSGLIYTTHIPIIAPKLIPEAYLNMKHTERNQKPSYSTTIQGVVDSLGVFTDICVGYPGSMSNDKILEISELYQRFNTGNYPKDIWVVGNSGYPLLDWLLVPYTDTYLAWTQQLLNEKIIEIQKTAKDAFMRLKGRWTCLRKQSEVRLQDFPVVLEACCVLHNICEIYGEAMDADLRFHLFDDKIPMAENGGGKSVIAVKSRDSTTYNLLHTLNK